MISSALHLHPLDYSLDNIKLLNNEQLALVQFHPDIDDQDESTLLKVHRIWSNRREKYRVKLGTEEGLEKDSLLSIELSFPLDDLLSLSSEQLSLIQFHPDVTELIQLKAEKVWRSRREKDLLKGFIWKNKDSMYESIAKASSASSPSITTLSPLQQDNIKINEMVSKTQPELQLHSSIASTSKLTIEEQIPPPATLDQSTELSIQIDSPTSLATTIAISPIEVSNVIPVDLSTLPILPIPSLPISTTSQLPSQVHSNLPSRPISYPAKPSGRTKIPYYTSASDQIHSIRVVNLPSQEVRSLNDLRYILPDRLLPDACVLLGGRQGSRFREGFFGWSNVDRKGEALKLLASMTLRGTRVDAFHVENQQPQWEWCDLTTGLADRLWKGDCERKQKTRDEEAREKVKDRRTSDLSIIEQVAVPTNPYRKSLLDHSASSLFSNSQISNHISLSQEQYPSTASRHSSISQVSPTSHSHSINSASLPSLPFSSSRVPLHLIEPLFPMTLSFTTLPPSLQYASSSTGTSTFNMIKQIYACRPLPLPRLGFYFLFSDRSSRVAARETFEKMNFKGGDGMEITPDGPDVQSWEWAMMEKSFRAVNCPASYRNGSLVNGSSSTSTDSFNITSPMVDSISLLPELPEVHGSFPSSAIPDSPPTQNSPITISIPLNQHVLLNNSPSPAPAPSASPLPSPSASISGLSGSESRMQLDHSILEEASIREEDFDESLDTEGHALPVGWIRIGSLQHESRFFYYNQLEDQRIWENPNILLPTPAEETRILEEVEVETEVAPSDASLSAIIMNRSLSISSEEDELESLEVEKQLAVHSTSTFSPLVAPTIPPEFSYTPPLVRKKDRGTRMSNFEPVSNSKDNSLTYRPIKKKYKSPSSSFPINFASTSHLIYQEDPPSYNNNNNNNNNNNSNNNSNNNNKNNKKSSSYYSHPPDPLESSCAAPSLLARTIALKIQGSASSSSLVDRIQDNTSIALGNLPTEPLADRLVTVHSSKYKGKGKGKRSGEKIDLERGGKKKNRGGLFDRLA